VNQRWPILRLVVEKVASLQEIRESWSLRDVMQVNALLDFKRDSQIANMPKKGR
jgi:hypothetical protein